MILRPIIHRDGHTAAVENEVVAYFREAVFTPLVLLLQEHNIQTRSNSAWVQFPAHLAPLPLARRDLPQIPTDRLGEFIDFMALRGVRCEECSMPAEAFRPSQSGYWPEKLEPYDPEMTPIITSRNFTIADGHHRWYAAYLHDPRSEVPCLRFACNFEHLRVFADAFDGSRRENATSALVDALRAGRVMYQDGRFSGPFNALISRDLRSLGATFDKPTKTFRLAHERLPYYLRGAVAESLSRSRDAHDAVLALLLAMQLNIDSAPVVVEAQAASAAVLGDIENQFRDSMAVAGLDDFPVFGEEGRNRLTTELTENLALGIKDFMAERLPELRRKVQENFELYGGNTERLGKVLEAEFGFAKRRAAFLAEHETALMIAKYRQLRYESLGSQEYFWETKRDLKVRPGHAALQGRRFAWTNPPVADPATGRRCHPGEDYNCRCHPRPIINIPTTA